MTPFQPVCILCFLHFWFAEYHAREVDAHVGRSLFEDVIVGDLRNRGVTVLLVTHAIHFLSQVDYIYTMNNGMIVERGTYLALIAKGGEFSRLALEYGGQNPTSIEGDINEDSLLANQKVTVEDAKLKSALAREQGNKGDMEGRLIVKERRHTGSVSSNGMCHLHGL